MPCVIDLYAGAGGLSLGASRAGFHVVAALELDDQAIKTHTMNFPHTKHFHCDIRDISGIQIVEQIGRKDSQIAGIIGGPPCQGFSAIGHGCVDDERNTLFVRFFQIVAEIRPLFFVAENVPGIMKEKYNSLRNRAFSSVNEYNMLAPLRVDASEYGAATSRVRFFFIGIRKDVEIQLTSADFLQAKVSSKNQTCVEQALEGLPCNIQFNKNQSGVQALEAKYCIRNGRHKQPDYFYERVTDLVPSHVGDREFIDTYRKRHITNGFLMTEHTKDVRERYRKLRYGERDKVSKSQRLHPEKFCPTLRAGTGPDKGSYQAVRPIHYRLPRVINPREAARLQGFPDWYKLPDTIWHSFRQIGNSVSPIVAEAILRVLYKKLFQHM